MIAGLPLFERIYVIDSLRRWGFRLFAHESFRRRSNGGVVAVQIGDSYELTVYSQDPKELPISERYEAPEELRTRIIMLLGNCLHVRLARSHPREPLRQVCDD